MENSNERDEILFAQLKKAKRRKRRRVIITVVVLLLLILVGGAGAVMYLRARVRTQFATATAEVKSAQAVTGRISSNVSGSGSLSYMDFEDATIPAAVTVEELLITPGETLAAGDLIARVDLNSVMTAMADTQSALEDLDDQISDAKSDAVSSQISASVPGRVKCVYAQQGDAVMDVMMEHGAIACRTHCRGGYHPPAQHKSMITNRVGRIRTTSNNSPPTVGEARSLPRSIKSEYGAGLGEFVQFREKVPFNGTLNCGTLREDDILPYGGRVIVGTRYHSTERSSPSPGGSLPYSGWAINGLLHPKRNT